MSDEKMSIFEYAPAPESQAVVTIEPEYGLFINGKFINSKRHFPTVNPANGKKLSSISQASVADVNKAVIAARTAYVKVWSKMAPAERAKYLYRIAREEIFGPVLSILTFRTPAEAIEKANNTPFGLSAGIWSEKGSRILWASKHLQAGVIWANTFNKFDPTSPFGGYKESGWGREGGRHGLSAYLASGKAGK